jgi:zinc protease
MNTAIRYPSFDADEMRKENEVVDREFQRNESEPFYALNDTIAHHLWGNLYSRKKVIGNHDVIRSATPALMDSIKSKYYYPDNSLLIIAGDVMHDDVFKQVESLFDDWKPAGFDPFTRWPIPEFKPLSNSDYVIVPSQISKVPYIRFTWMGPDTRHDVQSNYAADVFSFAVEQNASKFKQALVQSGLASAAGINYLTLSHTGPIYLYVVPNPDKIKECFVEVKRQIDLFDSDNYVTDEQLAAAKLKLDAKQLERQEVTTDFVHTLSFWWASASIDYYTNYNDNLKKVSQADLKAYVNKYIKGKPFVAGLLVPASMSATLKAETFFKN